MSIYGVEDVYLARIEFEFSIMNESSIDILIIITYLLKTEHCTMTTAMSTATSAATGSSTSNKKKLHLMERLVWIRRTSSSNNSSGTSSFWWPAVYCESHLQAMGDFASRMARGPKAMAGLTLIREQRQGTSMPVLVPITGRGRTVTFLKATDTTEQVLGRDFFGAHFMEFSTLAQDEDNSNSKDQQEAYQACLDELEELLEQAAEETVEETTSSPDDTDTTNSNESFESSERNVVVAKAPAVEPANVAVTVNVSIPAITATSKAQPQADDFPVDNNDNNEEEDIASSKHNDSPEKVTPIPSIQPRDTWDVVWAEMENMAGWWRRTGGKPYLYIKPGRNTRPGESVAGVDYFDTIEQVQDFCRQHYGWLGPPDTDVNENTDDNDQDTDDNDQDEDGSLEETVAAQTPRNQKTKPRDPGAPLYSSDDSSSDDGDGSSSSDTSSGETTLAWHPLWKRLKQAGWFWERPGRGSLMEGYYYVRPGRDVKTGREGVDYFISDKDVIAYNMREDAKEREQTKARKNSKKRKSESSSNNINNNNNKKATKTTNTSKSVASTKSSKSTASVKSSKSVASVKSSKSVASTKPVVSTKETKAKSTNQAKSVAGKKRAATGTANVPGNNNKKKKSPQKNDGHWWKNEAVPSFHDAWPALVKLGFYDSDNGYHLPENVCDKDAVVFKSYTGLRKFLCGSGIPNYDISKLESDEDTRMQRWVRFANVPVSSRDSVRKLENVRSPRKPDAVKKLLVIDHGWGTYDGKLCVPGADTNLENRQRKENVHYFKEENTNKLRCYVRGALVLGSSGQELASAQGVTMDTPPKARVVNESKSLELRLWAATSSEKLPVFKELPHKDKLSVLQHIDEEDEDDEEEEEEHQAETDLEESESGSVSEASTAKQEEINLIPPEEDSPSKESVETVETAEIVEPPKKKKRDNRPWYIKEPLPSFTQQIWPTLRVFGFQYSSRGYSHPSIVGTDFADTDSLRKFICRHGIPNYEKGMDILTLYRWVVFANVPVSESNSMCELEKVTLLSDNKLLEILIKLGFACFDNKYFPPGSDSIKGCRGKREEGVHYHLGLEGIRAFIRGHENFYIGDADSQFRPSRKRSKAPVVNEVLLLSLRLWAALSLAPLPTFKPVKAETKEDPETEETPNEIREDPEVKSMEEEPQEDELESNKDLGGIETKPNEESLDNDKDTEDAELKSSEDLQDTEIDPNEESFYTAEEEPQGAEMKSSEDLQGNDVQLNEESIDIEAPPHGETETEETVFFEARSQDEMETEPDETVGIEARPQDEMNTVGAEAYSKEEEPAETEILLQDENFEIERDQENDEQLGLDFVMTQPDCEQEYSDDEDEEDELGSPADTSPIMQSFAESLEKSLTVDKTRRVTVGPTESRIFEQDWDADEMDTDNVVTPGWPVSDSLGHSRFEDNYSYMSQTKTPRGESKNARVSLAPSDNDVEHGGLPWGLGTQADPDEELV
jgi:hypothetical protein